jgi:hypothetical protein
MKLKALLLVFLLFAFLSVSFVTVAKATEATGYFHNIWVLIVKANDDMIDAMMFHDILVEQYPNNTKHRYLGPQVDHADLNDPRVDDGNPLTPQVLNDTIHNWLGQAEDDDLIFIYINGHGEGYNQATKKVPSKLIEYPPDDEGPEITEADVNLDFNGNGKVESDVWAGVDECFIMHNRYADYWVKDDEFKQMLSGLKYKTMVVAMQTCYSRGFIEELTAPDRIIITACNETTTAKGFRVSYGSYPNYLKASFQFVDMFNYTEPIFPEVDADGNGKVSITEAFIFAYINDLARINGEENPQLCDWGLAGTTFLGQPKIYRLTIWASYGGTTDPLPGKHYYFAGAKVTINAYADDDWRFGYWLPDDYPYPSLAYIFLTNPTYTIAMDKDHLVYAYFLPEDGKAGGGDQPCPTLLVWNGSGYVDYGVINIHNPTGEDVVKEVPVLVEDVGISNDKAKFRLREGWEGLNFSESVIDQVKLYAVGKNGKRYLCPLISATHSSLGNVLPQLLASDDYRVQMLLLETIDLTFIIPYQNIQGFTFVIEGCNMFKM